MGRPRKNLGSDGDARLVALVGQGWTAEAIAADLKARGISVSRSTIDTRMRALRGPVAPSRSPAGPSFARELEAASGGNVAPPPAPESGELPDGDDFPSEDALRETVEQLLRGLPIGQHREFLTMCWKEFRTTTGPLKASWATRLLAAMVELRKAFPPEPPDPNDQPDMVKLGAEVEARFFKMLDMVVEEHVAAAGGGK